MIDGGRQWWLAATTAAAFLYLTKAYVATCNDHATRAFVKCNNMWLEEVGSNGQGLAICAVAVDAANEVMVVNVCGCGPFKSLVLIVGQTYVSARNQWSRVRGRKCEPNV